MKTSDYLLIGGAALVLFIVIKKFVKPSQQQATAQGNQALATVYDPAGMYNGMLLNGGT